MNTRPALRALASVAAVLALSSAAARAQEDETTITATWFSDWGEAKYEEPFDHLDYVNPDAPKGGEIVLSTVGSFDSMNPFATLTGSPAMLSSMPYERLMESVADEAKAASYCLLCETIEYPESQEWVIFHLRDDVTFSDGTPMTAEDVVFTHKKFIAEGTPSWRSGVSAMITDVEALDAHTVKFTFAPDIPRNGLIGQAGATIVMQKKWFDETGARLDEKRYQVSPGTGAYMLDGYDAGQWVAYRRNPDYWGLDHPLKRGRQNYDRIRIVYFGDTNLALEAFAAGEITFRLENSSINWATSYDFPAVHNGSVVKAELPDGNVPNALGFVFNMRREKFADRNLRLALGLMYNFTWTNDALQYGLFAQRESFWQNSPLMAEGLPDGRELDYLEGVRDLLPEEIFTEEAQMPHSSGDRSLDRRNLRQALALMEEAGYTPGSGGKLRDAEGRPFTLEFLSANPSFDRIFIPYVENLQALGVEARYNRVDPSQYQARRQAFDYDMIYDGYQSGLEEGAGMQQKYGSKEVNDIFNPAGYSREAVDRLIEEVIRAETYDDMTAAVRAIDRVMRYDYFMVPTYYNDSYWVAYYDMYDHPPLEQMPAYDLGYLDFWWYNADKAAELRAAGALK
ncbi:extracellular solute-binding protein [Celeribacter indicus]|uniref:Oligopeptide/dipeptide uptake family ABC transporter, periplasmic substrate-binding protein n=1 Tax=Celeribacter indicus TaxID=1208324 RepID=A0A0B5E0V7_9RHOB|nr:extracellular solute-binding protein [Celeribacter indicus]AJE48919.1 oligopeptide/dipeptide uptake family ABC transporter, periplasmic substrate-binding protein [Celeribacter indicus]SDW41156.1 microcin C transport system substrate-binding protein [Celeribacter indicus]